MEMVVCQLQGHLEREKRGGVSERGLCITVYMYKKRHLHGRWVYRRQWEGDDSVIIQPNSELVVGQ